MPRVPAPVLRCAFAAMLVALALPAAAVRLDAFGTRCHSLESCRLLAYAGTGSDEHRAAAMWFEMAPTSDALRESLFAMLESGNDFASGVAKSALPAHLRTGDEERLAAVLERDIDVCSLLAQLDTDDAFAAVTRYVERDAARPHVEWCVLGFKGRARALGLAWLRRAADAPALARTGFAVLLEFAGTGPRDAVDIELLRLLTDGGEAIPVRVLAFHALYDRAELGDDATVLLAILQEPPSDVRHLVAAALARDERAEALPMLIDALASAPMQSL